MPLASLLIAIFIPIALAGLSRLIASRGIKPIFYLVALLGLGLAGGAIFRIINPSLLKTIMGRSIGIFRAWPTETTVLEMQPLFFPDGSFSTSVAWGNFTTGFFLSLISLGVLIYFIVKRGEADKTLFVVWSLIILAATLSMRRFGYYFVVNVALLTGYLSWLILEFAGFREAAAVPVETRRIVKRGKARVKKRWKSGFRITTSHIYMAFGVVVVFFLSFFPNISPAINTASQTPFAPSDAWCQSLSWLKDNTPEPFGNPDFYYELYEPPPPGERYSYPETAYGVTAWCDYGYWITRLGHRIPTSNPGTGHRGESHLFAAQDEASANKIMDTYAGSRYVIVDYDLAILKFYAVAALSGSSKEQFYDVYYYYEPQEGKLKPIRLFYPEYYRSLVIRLYNFDGNEVIPQSSTVISYQEKINRDGNPYKEITSSQIFPSYEEAEAYISSQESGKYRIVGNDRFISPVPLEPLEHYKLIYRSDKSIMQTGAGTFSEVSEVKIFEYVAD